MSITVAKATIAFNIESYWCHGYNNTQQGVQEYTLLLTSVELNIPTQEYIVIIAMEKEDG